MNNPGLTWGTRLKQARERKALSQRELGVRAGLDPSVASTRINRYELGVHKADYLISQRLASVLEIPVAYLYTDDDQLAKLILHYHSLNPEQRRELCEYMTSRLPPHE